jgi:hypothetical protein
MFDPYRKWLGIPDGQRPPSHYQLLGIAPDENDRDVINAAVVRQSAFIRTFQTGQHSKEATQLLNELAAAKICLLDPGRRARYDAQLATTMAPNQANATNPADNWHASPSSPRLAPAKPQSPPPRPARPVAAPPTTPRAPPPTAPINYAPLLSVPEEIWAAVESPPPQPIFRGPQRSPARLPHWLWFVPAGSVGLLVVILLASALMRRPARIVGGDEPKTVTTGAPATSSTPVSPGPVVSAPAPPPKARPTRSAAERLDVDRALLQAGATVTIPVSS